MILAISKVLMCVDRYEFFEFYKPCDTDYLIIALKSFNSKIETIWIVNGHKDIYD